MYSGCEMEFDGAGSSSFVSDFYRNAVILDVDNSSSIHTDNHKINFLE